MVAEQTKYLIDSDILIAMLRDTGDKTGLRRKALEVGLQNCYVSSISLAELSSGAYRMASDRGLFEVEFIKKIFNILPFGSNEYEDVGCFGRSKALLYGAGIPIDDMDLLIGSSALAGGFTMVTHNVRHFSHIPGLAIKDWMDLE
jgi:tRNA(fMet)-specific endonuclease VapC